MVHYYGENKFSFSPNSHDSNGYTQSIYNDCVRSVDGITRCNLSDVPVAGIKEIPPVIIAKFKILEAQTI